MADSAQTRTVLGTYYQLLLDRDFTPQEFRNFLLSIYTAAEIDTAIAVAVAASQTALTARPRAKFSTGTTTTTFTAGQLSGAAFVVYTNTGSNPGSIATRTATEMFGDDTTAVIGNSFMLRIVNGQGTGVLTVTAGSGVTLTGTATLAINSWRDFVVTYTSATALVMQQVGTGSFS